ncbi:hypothetical protein [Chryseobacterium chendengshani]|nr:MULTISPECIES: hypothetical protein [unclassified Chryseobacterium]MBW8523927.1 hypothetical protein [Chryseobacterium sp. LJ668]QYK16867.1 hypothetical protein K0U91_01630 [Chryseobacterium sp. LJ668]
MKKKKKYIILVLLTLILLICYFIKYEKGIAIGTWGRNRTINWGWDLIW